jgi:hypothetical protein
MSEYSDDRVLPAPAKKVPMGQGKHAATRQMPKLWRDRVKSDWKPIEAHDAAVVDSWGEAARALREAENTDGGNCAGQAAAGIGALLLLAYVAWNWFDVALATLSALA